MGRMERKMAKFRNKGGHEERKTEEKWKNTSRLRHNTNEPTVWKQTLYWHVVREQCSWARMKVDNNEWNYALMYGLRSTTGRPWSFFWVSFRCRFWVLWGIEFYSRQQMESIVMMWMFWSANIEYQNICYSSSMPSKLVSEASVRFWIEL